jgi:hypothetical protein
MNITFTIAQYILEGERKEIKEIAASMKALVSKRPVNKSLPGLRPTEECQGSEKERGLTLEIPIQKHHY